MSAQPLAPAPHMPDKTFTGVRTALFHPDDIAEFDAEYAELTSAPIVPMAALDEFLARWWRTAIVANRDRDDWHHVLETVERLRNGERPTGRSLADVARERGYEVAE
ncbi:DUF6247 family protein [Nonomuraea sp. 10N515B]|uniref:DUF6247 family protein n=1 Tax=Nonomuraea sp. 10N515B TaxID=3457422 RepID=UPI003FCE417E